ncbi:unnamed protein product [Brugia pahangi]|uniref:Phosphoribosyl-ATP diphosphatase n=1 Tax=Brugia pahangi TaxID=6280 RepID=A0A0N4T764_BRUPA|nr:unnamed protein product [Brugia pahangi]
MDSQVKLAVQANLELTECKEEMEFQDFQVHLVMLENQVSKVNRDLTAHREKAL